MELALLPDFAINNDKYYTLFFINRKKVVQVIAYIAYEECIPCDIENVLSYYTTGTLDYLPVDHYINILPDTEGFMILKAALKALIEAPFRGEMSNDETPT